VRHFENEIEFQFQLGMLRAALLECQEIENQVRTPRANFLYPDCV
jgi:hypothetical protein